MKPETEVLAIEKKADDDINREALRQLIDMGFPSERAKRALKLNNMSPLEAMDWLLAYESSSAFPSHNTNILPSIVSVAPSSSQPVVSDNLNVGIFSQVPAIVECYRCFKRKQFKPNTKAYANLKQMGFDEEEVLDSLWVHSNNEVSAVSINCSM